MIAISNALYAPWLILAALVCAVVLTGMAERKR